MTGETKTQSKTNVLKARNTKVTETKTWSTPNIETCLRKQALIDGSFIFCHARMVVDKFVVPQDHNLSAWYKSDRIGPSDPRTTGLFFWTIFFGLFLDHSVWTFYWTNFWTIFFHHFIGGEADHWNAVYQYSRRGGRQAVVNTNY